jgi:uncharacterized lipoprotein NlpE involved in copper resistance
MKRITVLLLAFVLLLSIGCHNQTGPEPEPAEAPTPEPTEAPSCREAILGDWEFHSILIGRERLDPAVLGLESSFSFYANGAGMVKAWRGDDVHEDVFTYTVSGNEITMLDEDNDPMTAVYDPDTDTLILEEENLSIVLVRKTAEPDPTPEPSEEPDWTKAELTEETDDAGGTLIVITAAIPAGATLRIFFPHQDDYTYTNTGRQTAARRVKIPVEVFFPNTPLEQSTVEITPAVTVTTADGVEHEVDCPSFTHTFPMLLLAIDSDGDPGKDAFRAKADETGVYHLYGMVLSGEEGMPAVDAGVTLTVNGEETPVYEGGIFHAELKLEGGAPTTYVLTAEKNNYMTVTVTVIVEPDLSDT